MLAQAAVIVVLNGVQQLRDGGLRPEDCGARRALLVTLPRADDHRLEGLGLAGQTVGGPMLRGPILGLGGQPGEADDVGRQPCGTGVAPRASHRGERSASTTALPSAWKAILVYAAWPTSRSAGLLS